MGYLSEVYFTRFKRVHRDTPGYVGIQSVIKPARRLRFRSAAYDFPSPLRHSLSQKASGVAPSLWDHLGGSVGAHIAQEGMGLYSKSKCLLARRRQGRSA